MKINAAERAVLVSLPASFVEALVKMHATFGTDLAGALKASVADRPSAASEQVPWPASKVLPLRTGKYSAEFLGIPFTTWTLPEIFAEIVDMTAKVAPEALDRLSGKRARRRRFVAQTPEAIHPGIPRLPVMQTASGWWISKNIGREDLKRALKALSDVAGLEYGKDVKFSSPPGGYQRMS